MRNCIPDELMNLIPYPEWGGGETSIDRIVQEIRYKVPLADDILIKKEVWHAVCDFCYRLGALLERAKSSTRTVPISPQYGNFLRVVGAGVVENGFDTQTADISISDDRSSVSIGIDRGELDGTNNFYYVVFSSRPEFDNTVTGGDGKWHPALPAYFIEQYGECIMHGALMRIFVMGRPWRDIGLARMHAVAYNNDLNRLAFGRITSGMRRHLLIDVEDYIVNAQNGNG